MPAPRNASLPLDQRADLLALAGNATESCKDDAVLPIPPPSLPAARLEEIAKIVAALQEELDAHGHGIAGYLLLEATREVEREAVRARMARTHGAPSSSGSGACADQGSGGRG